MSSNTIKWGTFLGEILKSNIIWTIQKEGEFVTSLNSAGEKCFPWWSSKARVLSQLNVVPAYTGYQPAAYNLDVFLKQWIPTLHKSQCLLGINYEAKENIGFDLTVKDFIDSMHVIQDKNKLS